MDMACRARYGATLRAHSVDFWWLLHAATAFPALHLTAGILRSTVVVMTVVLLQMQRLLKWHRST